MMSRPGVERLFVPGTQTPLHTACLQDNGDIVSCIVYSGKVDSDIKDDRGETPRQFAQNNKKRNALKVLIRFDIEKDRAKKQKEDQ
jgi:ankyrin repeat protein